MYLLMYFFIITLNIIMYLYILQDFKVFLCKAPRGQFTVIRRYINTLLLLFIIIRRYVLCGVGYARVLYMLSVLSICNLITFHVELNTSSD